MGGLVSANVDADGEPRLGWTSAFFSVRSAAGFACTGRPAAIDWPPPVRASLPLPSPPQADLIPSRRCGETGARAYPPLESCVVGVASPRLPPNLSDREATERTPRDRPTSLLESSNASSSRAGSSSYLGSSACARTLRRGRPCRVARRAERLDIPVRHDGEATASSVDAPASCSSLMRLRMKTWESIERPKRTTNRKSGSQLVMLVLRVFGVPFTSNCTRAERRSLQISPA